MICFRAVLLIHLLDIIESRRLRAIAEHHKYDEIVDTIYGYQTGVTGKVPISEIKVL
jgi:hypothetical protein